MHDLLSYTLVQQCTMDTADMVMVDMLHQHRFLSRIMARVGVADGAEAHGEDVAISVGTEVAVAQAAAFGIVALDTVNLHLHLLVHQVNLDSGIAVLVIHHAHREAAEVHPYEAAAAVEVVELDMANDNQVNITLLEY